MRRRSELKLTNGRPTEAGRLVRRRSICLKPLHTRQRQSKNRDGFDDDVIFAHTVTLFHACFEVPLVATISNASIVRGSALVNVSRLPSDVFTDGTVVATSSGAGVHISAWPGFGLGRRRGFTF